MKKSLVKNAADKKQVKEAETKENLVGKQAREDLAKILETAGGKRFIWSLLSECGVFKTSFNHSGSITNFNEGRRTIGLSLLSKITNASPESLIEMMRDNSEDVG